MDSWNPQSCPPCPLCEVDIGALMSDAAATVERDVGLPSGWFQAHAGLMLLAPYGESGSTGWSSEIGS